MQIERIKVGYLKCNCYILTINNECLVIDPGAEYEKIEPYLKDKKVIGVLITHNHFDHIGALSNFDSNLVHDYNSLAEKEYKIGSFIFIVIYTKGHTNDLVTYYFKEEKIMFTGDFLFRNCIGRTDLETSSDVEMKKSLDKIKNYPDDIVIYPGHGDHSILGLEKQNIDNYYN